MTTDRRRILFVTTAAILAIATLPAVFIFKRLSPPSTLEKIRSQGVVRVGFANEAPYSFLDRNGQFTGESAEIARAVFRKMGIHNIEPVLTDFTSLIPDLKAGRIDVIAAGMFITAERSQVISFSLPTYRVGPAFLVKKGNPQNLISFESVRDNPGVTLAVLHGAVEVSFATKAGVPKDRILIVPDLITGVEAVETGRAHAFVLSRLSVNNLMLRNPNYRLEVADPFHLPPESVVQTEGYGAFGFRKEDTSLRETFDAELQNFLLTPEHIALVRPFGFDHSSLIPPTSNIGELISGSRTSAQP